MPSQDGRTVIVTGGAGGVGTGICEVFADQGANLAVWISTVIVPSNSQIGCRELVPTSSTSPTAQRWTRLSIGLRRISGGWTC